MVGMYISEITCLLFTASHGLEFTRINPRHPSLPSIRHEILGLYTPCIPSLPGSMFARMQHGVAWERSFPIDKPRSANPRSGEPRYRSPLVAHPQLLTQYPKEATSITLLLTSTLPKTTEYARETPGELLPSLFFVPILPFVLAGRHNSRVSSAHIRQLMMPCDVIIALRCFRAFPLFALHSTSMAPLRCRRSSECCLSSCEFDWLRSW